jgi:AcrR family transcriptional regulator
MLLYYFGSKEEVLREATLVAFERFPHLEGALRRLAGDGGRLRERLVRVWPDIAHPDNRPFLALFFQTFAVALYHPERNAALLDRLGGDWVAAVADVLEREGLQPADAADVATQLVAAWRGLQLALLSGVPRADLDRAARGLVDRLPLETLR